MKKTLKITCIGYLDFRTGKVYSTKAELLAAKAVNKCKNLFNLAVMRKWLIEAKIALLRLKAYTWKTSCRIASLLSGGAIEELNFIPPQNFIKWTKL